MARSVDRHLAGFEVILQLSDGAMFRLRSLYGAVPELQLQQARDRAVRRFPVAPAPTPPARTLRPSAAPPLFDQAPAAPVAPTRGPVPRPPIPAPPEGRPWGTADPQVFTHPTPAPRRVADTSDLDQLPYMLGLSLRRYPEETTLKRVHVIDPQAGCCRHLQPPDHVFHVNVHVEDDDALVGELLGMPRPGTTLEMARATGLAAQVRDLVLAQVPATWREGPYRLVPPYGSGTEQQLGALIVAACEQLGLGRDWLNVCSYRPNGNPPLMLTMHRPALRWADA